MKHSLMKLFFLLAGGAAMAVAASAQTSQETPESAARAYMDASRVSDWAKAASLMHPDALKQLRSLFGPIVSATKTEKDMETMFGVKDQAEFDRLSDADIFAKLFNMITSLSPEMKNILSNSSFHIIGQVPESPEVTHVVYRMHLKIETPNVKEPVGITKLEVMSLRRFENTWRAELEADLQGIIQGMAAAMTAEKEQESAAPPPQAPAKKRPARRP